jgi:multiple sugar transport system permease protein
MADTLTTRSSMIAPVVRRAARGQGLLLAALLLGACVMLFPFAWMVSTSLTAGADLSTPSLVPADPTLDSYRRLAEALPFGRIALNSLWIAAASTALQLFTSAMAAYAFARLDFRGRQVVFLAYLATLMVPMQVLVVALFIELRTFALIDTYFALLAPTAASAFGVFLLRQAIQQVPTELDEAARIDGAGHLRIFLHVILPQIRPALATFAIFAFMASWNSFLWPLVAIRSPELMTLPVGLATLQGQYTTEWNVLMAGSVASVIPIVVLYLAAQRHVIQSVAQSGLK